jgi:hypothetical protein
LAANAVPDNYLARRFTVFISLDIKSLMSFCTHGAEPDVVVRVLRVVVVAVRPRRWLAVLFQLPPRFTRFVPFMIIAQHRFSFADGMYSIILNLPCSLPDSALGAFHRSDPQYIHDVVGRDF